MSALDTVRFFARLGVASAVLMGACVLAVADSANETGSVAAVAGQGSGSPIWAQSPLFSSSRAVVSRIVSTATADVVVLGGGHNEGLREGMACEIYRHNELIAELMIVRCKTESSAALITALKADTGIVPGDVAKIKTVHTF